MGFSRQEYWSGCHASSRASSPPRDGMCISYVSCTGRFFTANTAWGGSRAKRKVPFGSHGWVLGGHEPLKEYIYALRALPMCVGRGGGAQRSLTVLALQRVCDSQKLENNCYLSPRRGWNLSSEKGFHRAPQFPSGFCLLVCLLFTKSLTSLDLRHHPVE